MGCVLVPALTASKALVPWTPGLGGLRRNYRRPALVRAGGRRGFLFVLAGGASEVLTRMCPLPKGCEFTSGGEDV